MADFKVICVKAFNKIDPGCVDLSHPQVGDINTVTEEYMHPLFKRLYYCLDGYAWDDLFLASNFAVLPDKSADEMREEEKEAIINLEKSFV